VPAKSCFPAGVHFDDYGSVYQKALARDERLNKFVKSQGVRQEGEKERGAR